MMTAQFVKKSTKKKGTNRIKTMAPPIRKSQEREGQQDFITEGQPYRKKNDHKQTPIPCSSKPPQLTPRVYYSYLHTNSQCSVNQQWIEHEQRQLDPRATMATPRTLKLTVNRVTTPTLLPVTRTIEPSENFLFVYMFFSICIALLIASQIMSGWYGIANLGNWLRSIFEKFRMDDLSSVRFLKRLCSWFWMSTKEERTSEELVHPDKLSDEEKFEKILQELRGPENAAVEEYECSLKRLIENPEKSEQKEEDFRNRAKELAEKLEGIRRQRRENQHDAIPTDDERITTDSTSNFTREPFFQRDSIAYRTRSACNREQKRVNDKPNILSPETNDVEKQEDDQLTADNFLPQQSSSSLSDYEDDFASLERISQEELAKKLADLDRSYGEKLKTARRIRKERNEDAQEEIRAIKESQKERLRLFHQK